MWTTAIFVFLFQIGFQQALPGYEFSFPRDHGSHPAYKLEWWYFTGQLTDDSGRRFGYELTFFRTAITPRPVATGSRWRASQLFPAHFALTDVEGGKFHYFEKLNRSFPGIASASEDRLHVRNENWTVAQEGETFRLHAGGPDLSLDLQLVPRKPAVIHGVDGVSRKGPAPGQASHYYSLTRLLSEGSLDYEGKVQKVIGTTWMDHEFMSNQLADNQVGWDWFSIQLDNGYELMLFQLREEEGQVAATSSGTLVDPEGQGAHLGADAFQIGPSGKWTSPNTGTTYPMNWKVEVPSVGLSLTLTSLLEDQELDATRSTGVTYWEGAVGITGVFGGVSVRGQGYVEMTGYDGKGPPKI